MLRMSGSVDETVYGISGVGVLKLCRADRYNLYPHTRSARGTAVVRVPEPGCPNLSKIPSPFSSP